MHFVKFLAGTNAGFKFANEKIELWVVPLNVSVLVIPPYVITGGSNKMGDQENIYNFTNGKGGFHAFFSYN